MSRRFRKFAISIFVATWILIFHYESLRLNYLSPLFGRELPKLKLLFPPAGWIMFFKVEPYEGRSEVYGQRNGRLELIDPHRIFSNRWIGYDNIRRNVLISAAHPYYAREFSAYLRRKFPEYDGFVIVQALYPDPAREPDKVLRKAVYKC